MPNPVKAGALSRFTRRESPLKGAEIVMDAGKATHDFDRLMLAPLITGGNARPWRRELAVLEDSSSAVRVWLDTSGPSACLLVEDVDSGEQIELDATQLFQLVLESNADDCWTVRRTR